MCVTVSWISRRSCPSFVNTQSGLHAFMTSIGAPSASAVVRRSSGGSPMCECARWMDTVTLCTLVSVREVLDQLFKSLLHKLMTGEVCIDDLDLTGLPKIEGSAA